MSSNQETMGAAIGMFGDLQKNWGWLLALGILFLILGTIGLGMSFALTLVSVLYFGILLLIGGGVQLVQAFQCKGWKGVLWHVLIALAYIVAGVLMVYDPAEAAIALTLVMAIALLVVGVSRIIMSLQLKPAPGWWWALLAGIASLVLGAIIFAQWPVSGLWVIGLLIAIELIFNGWSYIFIALAAKRTSLQTGAGPTAGVA